MRSRTFSALALRATLLVPTVLIGTNVVAAAAPIKVMTYNTFHGGTGSSPASTDSQIDLIAAENPDVVVLQEAYSTQFDYYVNGLNARQHTTAWHGSYNRTCSTGVEPNCTKYTTESVMIITKLKTLAVTPRLIWAKDSYHVARASLRMSVELADGTPVNVFVAHLPALSSGRTARMTWVTTFKTWSASFAGATLVGGDFNDWPSDPSIVAMKQQFNDGWLMGGTGKGLTHLKDGVPYSRLDYWFADKTSGVALTKIAVTGNANDSDHLAVVASYAVPSTATAPAATTTTTTPTPTTPVTPATTTPTAPTTTTTTTPVSTQVTLFADTFDAVDATQWPTRVITGTQDASIFLAVGGGRLQIGDLKESLAGTHYNGISSAAYNVANNGCASVQLAQGLNAATRAYAMFAVVRDTNNLYRWYQSGGSLIAERKINGVKKTLVDLQYSATAHQFLRIRKVTNSATGTQDVVFETAPNVNGVAGAYTERHRETWAASVNASGLKLEIKAGTSAAEAGAGAAYWDNALVATNCK
jgi:endonuclease/exonuclease/phosphatase family metal-dependent hydrolase